MTADSPETVALPLTGRCGCGAVGFEIDAPLLSAFYCHCRRCSTGRHGRAGVGAGRPARCA